MIHQHPTTKTARPTGSEVTNPANLPPSEWIRIPAAMAYTGLGRSLLYENFDTSGGPIRTACVKRRGAVRGVRLVSVSSLDAWLSSFAESNPTA